MLYTSVFVQVYLKKKIAPVEKRINVVTKKQMCQRKGDSSQDFQGDYMGTKECSAIEQGREECEATRHMFLYGKLGAQKHFHKGSRN
jgi:hypothetical protein